MDLGSTQASRCRTKGAWLIWKQLIRLDLLDCKKVSDASLEELVNFKNLRFFNLSITEVSDAGLKNLASLQQLAHFGPP